MTTGEGLLRKAKIVKAKSFNSNKKSQNITEFRITGSNSLAQEDFKKLPGLEKIIEVGKKIKMMPDGDIAIMRLGIEGHNPVLEITPSRQVTHSVMDSPKRVQSIASKKVYFAKAETPISHAKQLNLEVIFHFGKFTHFVFRSKCKNESEKYHSLKVDRNAPHRVTEENLAYSSVLKYFKSTTSLSLSRSAKCNVYVLWGTPYIQEMNFGGDLSNYKKGDAGEVFQIMIITEDEIVEFVAPQVIQWKERESTNLENIITDLTKELEL